MLLCYECVMVHLLSTISMITINTSNNSISSDRIVHPSIKRISISREITMFSEMIWGTTASKLPASIFSTITVIAVNTTDVIICIATEENWLIKTIDIICPIIIIPIGYRRTTTKEFPATIFCTIGVLTFNPVDSLLIATSLVETTIITVLPPL